MIWFITTRIGRATAGAGAAVLAFLGIIMAARRDAAKDALTQAENAEARSYIDKRKEIDNADLGIGANDAGRVKRLHDIADRQRGGGN